MARAPVGPNAMYRLSRLRAELKPFRLHFFPRLRSTNDHAAALRKRGELFAPAIVLTSHQIAGRGRGANRWFSAGGSLTVTFILPVEEHLSPLQLPLVAGLAVRNAAAKLTGNHQIELKWPNDVLHEGRKLAGLLCERLHKADLIGVGLNVNLDPADAPADLRMKLTSLCCIAGRRFDLNEVLITLAQTLHRTLGRRSEHPYAKLLEEYNQYHALTGRRIQVQSTPGESPLAGTCEGIDNIGRLLVRRGQTLHRILAGTVIVGE
jgi:BirA family biotin operon repressor/biotin-[acetyl-CoA-carboxylase] ligase